MLKLIMLYLDITRIFALSQCGIQALPENLRFNKNSHQTYSLLYLLHTAYVQQQEIITQPLVKPNEISQICKFSTINLNQNYLMHQNYDKALDYSILDKGKCEQIINYQNNINGIQIYYSNSREDQEQVNHHLKNKFARDFYLILDLLHHGNGSVTDILNFLHSKLRIELRFYASDHNKQIEMQFRGKYQYIQWVIRHYDDEVDELGTEHRKQQLDLQLNNYC